MTAKHTNIVDPWCPDNGKIISCRKYSFFHLLLFSSNIYALCGVCLSNVCCVVVNDAIFYEQHNYFSHSSRGKLSKRGEEFFFFLRFHLLSIINLLVSSSLHFFSSSSSSRTLIKEGVGRGINVDDDSTCLSPTLIRSPAASSDFHRTLASYSFSLASVSLHSTATLAAVL